MPPKLAGKHGLAAGPAGSSPAGGMRKRTKVHDDIAGFKLTHDEATIDLYTLDHTAMTAKLVQRGVLVSYDGSTFTATGKGGVAYALAEADWRALRADYDRYCQHGHDQHGRWLADGDWKILYQVADRPLREVNGVTVRDTAAIETVPCHYCGLLLPTRTIIQMDHHHPKAPRPFGGTRGGTRAVAKVLRAFDGTLMQGPAHGAKGTRFRAPTPIPPAKASFGAGSAMNRARYTPTDKGIFFLSMLIRVKTWVDVETKCVNSFLNMVPLCASCNGAGSKGAGLRRIA